MLCLGSASPMVHRLNLEERLPKEDQVLQGRDEGECALSTQPTEGFQWNRDVYGKNLECYFKPLGKQSICLFCEL